jgi:hypothetical protein
VSDRSAYRSRRSPPCTYLDVHRGIPVFPARTLSHRGEVVWEERPRLILARQHTLPFSRGRSLLLDFPGPQVQVDDSEADEKLRRKVLGLEDKSKHAAVPEQVRVIRIVPRPAHWFAGRPVGDDAWAASPSS